MTLLRSLTTSTGEPQSFFGGASQNASTVRWPQIQLKVSERRTQSEMSLVWSDDRPGVTFKHTISLQDQTEVSESTILRAYCHLFLGYLPDRGLSELMDSMKSIIDFYAVEESEAPIFLPTTTTLNATLGETSERPEFEIVEE